MSRSTVLVVDDEASIADGLRLTLEAEGYSIRIAGSVRTALTVLAQSEVQAALIRDPKVNYVIPIYDSMSQFAVPGIVAAGKTGKVQIATFNGTPFVMKMLQEDDVVAMEVGENLDWIGHAIIDAEMRIVCGLEPIANPQIPFYIFDEHNAADAGTPPQLSEGYGDAYVDGYAKKILGQ